MDQEDELSRRDVEAAEVQGDRGISARRDLKQMGMVDAFTVGKADLSGMTTQQKLYISAVVHKAFVDVNEKGTEAAAATAAVASATSAPPPATFNADHPFLFMIHNRATNTILFVGRVATPS